MYKKFKYCIYKQDVQIVSGGKEIIQNIYKTSFKLSSHISQKSQTTHTFCIFKTIGVFYDT